MNQSIEVNGKNFRRYWAQDTHGSRLIQYWIDNKLTDEHTFYVTLRDTIKFAGGDGLVRVAMQTRT